MLQQIVLNKGVALDVLGIFYVLRKHCSEVNREVIIPRFHLSPRVAQTHGLSYVNRDIPDDLEIVPLDYALLSSATSLPEKLVKECVNDIVVLFSWGAGLGEDYDLVFKGIGLLMSRNKSLTMRYSKEFLLAVDGPGIVLKSLLSNPSTQYWVLSGKDAAAFPVRPGGIRVLPTFEIKPGPGEKAKEPGPEGSKQREVTGSALQQPHHRRKRRSPGQAKGAKEGKGQQGSRKKPLDKEDFSPLLSSMRGNLQSATEDKLGEDLARERKQEGSPAEKRLLARRRLSPVKLPGLRMDTSVAQQGLGMQPPERSELARAHLATEGSFKALQEQQLIGGMPKESEKGGSPAEKCLLAQRRLSPMKLPGLQEDTSIGQQGLGMQPPERCELARAHLATEAPFKALQQQQLKGGMPKESEKGGSRAEKRLLARRRLSPVKLPGLRMDASVAQQGLGMQPPESTSEKRPLQSRRGNQ
ncbi:uncharacterized protein [Struthio camelus]|uniref:uncharacterized protein n=1 Tax=Struthio camelus TaxID=8801 RepID=UPI003603E9D2